MNDSPLRFQGKRLCASAVAAALLVQTIGPAHAVVSQVPPLFTPPPDVNVMFTLDDSGSMQADVIPDTVDTKTMSSAANSAAVSNAKYPKFWKKGSIYLQTGFFHSGNGSVSSAVADQAKVGRYLRSVAGNPLYYNPANTYRPWPRADNDKLLNANASINAVNISDDNPFDTTERFNLEARVNVSTTGASTSVSGLDNENQNYWLPTYFVYRGATPLLLANPQQAANTAANFTKVEIKRSVPSYPKAATRSDCAGATTCTYAEEIQNFANWLQYYRNRRLMTKGGVAEAFSKQGNNFRLGFATINSNPVVRMGVSKFEGARRTAFYNDMYPLGTPASFTTPLRVATEAVGRYFERSDIGNPWAQDPSSATTKGTEYSCRKSFHILSTDGYWNDFGAAPPAGGSNHDSFSGVTPTRSNGTAYAYGDSIPPSGADSLVGRFGINPFADSFSSTLSDVTAYYWKQDLRPDLVNNVSPSGRDPAFWQHLTTFTVGLGINGTGTVTKAGGALADLSTQTARDQLIANRTLVNWPNVTFDSPSTGDDLIHASMTGRGAYFAANNSKTLSDGLGAALAEALDQSVNSASLATESPLVVANQLAFQPSYNPYRWAGRLYAFPQGADGIVDTTPAKAAWEASNKMPAPAARKIYTWNGATRVGAPFTWAGLNTTQRGHLGNDSLVLDYLRGDGAKELQNGGSFRDRSRNTIGSVTGGVLGDIVNGSPLKGPSYGGGYDKLRISVPGQSTYANYRSSANAALIDTANTVFVGANDGMLHAFDTGSGVERFAYVADSLFEVPRSSGAVAEKKLRLLADPLYSHRFTMDGPPQIGDAFLGTEDTITGWKTVLLASAGAGARAIYALDVGDPANFAQSKVMWEFSEASVGAWELGFVTKYPHIAKMRNGKWVAIFGNGYDSVDGYAKLFILDLKTGEIIWRQPVGWSPNGNGLSQPNFIVNANREVETIYAGDLKGSLWKFDVNYVDPAAWKVAFGGTPFYRASNTGGDQAITVMPEITFHPNGGALVSFGTGKLFEQEDTSANTTLNTNLRTQTIYGIWDKPGETSGFSGTSNLVQQTATATGTSANAVSWENKRGWYINLDSGGERVIVNPLQVKSLLLVVANKPNVPLDPCGSDGTSRLFGLDPMTGGTPSFNVFGSTRAANVVSVPTMMSSPVVQQVPKAAAPATPLQVDPYFNNRGQTAALAGGVYTVPLGPQTNCSGVVSAGQTSGVFSSKINFCSLGKPRVSWRQVQ